MAKYRKKPVVIEAVQWTGLNTEEVEDFVGVRTDFPGPGFVPATEVTANVYDVLHGGWISVEAGDWIIKGVKGEFYGCKPDVFEEAYVPVVSSAEV